MVGCGRLIEEEDVRVVSGPLLWHATVKASQHNWKFCGKQDRKDAGPPQSNGFTPLCQECLVRYGYIW